MQIPAREVPPVGDGDFYVLGEALGQNEERAGIPFIGASGNLLFKTLKEFGIERKDCRIGNVVWVKPPFNDIEKFKQRNSILFENYRQRTLEDIKNSNPKIVLCLGSTALNLFFSDFKIKSARGFLFEWNGIPIIPTYHPSAVLREDKLYLPFRKDIEKAVRFYRTGQRIDFPTENFYPKNPAMFKEILNQSLREEEFVAIDIETSQGAEMRTSLIGVANRFMSANAFPTPDVIEVLRNFIEQRPDLAVFHNSSFDLSFLWIEFKIEPPEPVHDTMMMHHIIMPDQQKSLDFCASIWLNIPAWKHLRLDDPFLYNLMDVYATINLFYALKTELQRLDFMSAYEQKRKELLPSVFMSLIGVKLDEGKQEELRQKLEEEMKGIEQEIGALYPQTQQMNLNSPVQLKKFLYETLGLPPQREKGKISVSESAIKKLKRTLRRKPDKFSKELKFLELYLRWKELSSLKSKELQFKPNPNTKRVHTSYNVVGTESSRWSSSAPIWSPAPYGNNFQNRSKKFRSIFKPFSDDFLFIGADYSGAEAYIVAFRCEDEKTMKVFEENGDIHKLTASLMFNKSVEEVTKEERTIGKRIRHAGNYGMSWKKLSEIMEISASEAKELLELYHKAFPEIREVFHQRTEEIVRTKRLLRDAFGYPRTFNSLRIDQDDIREALAFYPQSTCTHTLNKALVRVWEETKDLDWIGLQFQIHDELVLVVRKDKELIRKAFELLDKAMTIEIPVYSLKTGRTIPLILRKEYKIGLNWGDMIEFKSLEELDKILRDLEL